MSLAGRTVLVTRPAGQCARLLSLLTDEQARPSPAPPSAAPLPLSAAPGPSRPVQLGLVAEFFKR